LVRSVRRSATALLVRLTALRGRRNLGKKFGRMYLIQRNDQRVKMRHTGEIRRKVVEMGHFTM
jgi:hypothetical protein